MDNKTKVAHLEYGDLAEPLTRHATEITKSAETFSETVDILVRLIEEKQSESTKERGKHV